MLPRELMFPSSNISSNITVSGHKMIPQFRLIMNALFTTTSRSTYVGIIIGQVKAIFFQHHYIVWVLAVQYGCHMYSLFVLVCHHTLCTSDTASGLCISCLSSTNVILLASHQIREIAGRAYAGNGGNVFPATDFKRNRTCRKACRDL